MATTKVDHLTHGAIYGAPSSSLDFTPRRPEVFHEVLQDGLRGRKELFVTPEGRHVDHLEAAIHLLHEDARHGPEPQEGGEAQEAEQQHASTALLAPIALRIEQIHAKMQQKTAQIERNTPETYRLQAEIDGKRP